MGLHWLKKLCRFQLYDSIIHPLYIVLCVHHPKSCLFPSSFIPLYSLLPPSTPPFQPNTSLILHISTAVLPNAVNISHLFPYGPQSITFWISPSMKPLWPVTDFSTRKSISHFPLIHLTSWQDLTVLSIHCLLSRCYVLLVLPLFTWQMISRWLVTLYFHSA